MIAIYYAATFTFAQSGGLDLETSKSQAVLLNQLSTLQKRFIIQNPNANPFSYCDYSFDKFASCQTPNVNYSEPVSFVEGFLISQKRNKCQRVKHDNDGDS